MQTILACATLALGGVTQPDPPAMTIPLTLQRWGEFSGYQHDHVEGTSFLRQWWLANDSVVIFVTYKCGVEMRAFETDAIDAMVRSLSGG